MSASELLEVLADLKENRRLSFEIDELIEPFAGKVYDLSLSLVSSSNTIGNRYGNEYNDGVTLVCAVGDGELEANLQLTPAETPFVESLAAGDSFQIRATLLDFDPLHLRAIFGSLPEETTPEEEPPPEEAEEQPVAEEPSVVAPIEVSEPEIEPIEPEIEPIEPEISELQAVEPEISELQPVEPQPGVPQHFEPPEEEIIQEEESGEEEDIQKERQALLSQLQETVEVRRSDSSLEAIGEVEQEQERIDYEGEEPEWAPISSQSKPPTQRQTGLPPQQPEETEKEGCLGCRGCLKAMVILMVLAFIAIITFSVKNETDRQETLHSTTWHKSDLEAFRALALEALHDPLNRTADGTLRLEENELFYLTKTAESTWGMLRSEFHGIENPAQLSAVGRQSLVRAYAWIALSAEAHQESLRKKLHTPAGRRVPFHLMLDGDLIEAKARVALRNPDMELDQSELNRVKVLDLSNEQLRDISYLKKLTHLERLNLSNNPLDNLIALSHLKRLRELRLENALVTNLVPIAEIKTLRHLSLANNPTLYLKPLERLKNLETLILTRGAASVQTPSLKKALPQLKIVYRKP